VRPRVRPTVHASRGIAEIVGTLMLVLIVVAASIAFAAFVASYQKQLQTQENATNQRNLESLRVLSLAEVHPEASPNQTNLENFTFVLASEYVNPSTIISISINGNPLRSFAAMELSPTPGTVHCNSSASPLVLVPFEQVEITVVTDSAASAGCGYSFFSSLTFPLDQFLQVSLFTQLQNTFTNVFLPPTAVPLVSTLAEFTGSGYENVPVLDGSHSFQSGNATITSWTWQVTNTTTGAAPPRLSWNASGEELVAPFLSTAVGANYTYSISLTVENSNGLLGIDTIVYAYLP
jgi:flagellin-like protein